jgi:hypothetical protein
MDPKVLTTAYLFMLAHTDIEPRRFEEINISLNEKLDSCSCKNVGQTPSDIVKAVLVDKLASIEGVDRIYIQNENGYQFETLGKRINGAGPVTVLIISNKKIGLEPIGDESLTKRT